MCDACRSLAESFERALSPEQHKGFEQWKKSYLADEQKTSFDGGYDAAKADDDAIYAHVHELHFALRELWNEIKKYIETNDGNNGARHVIALFETTFQQLPEDMRD